MSADYVDWPGQSGATYRYAFTNINDCYAVPANYTFVRKLPNGNWLPLYFGEAGDLNQRGMPRHERLAEAVKLGMTHFMTHRASASQETRRAEEADLIQRWNPPLNTHHRMTQQPYG
jgi:hypothetical protein